MKRFVGIDIGTTNVKAVLLDGKYRVRAWTSRKNDATAAGRGGIWYDPEGLFNLAAECVRKILEGNGEVEAIGVTGMAEAGLLLDGGGTPLTAILPWYDSRAALQMEEVERRTGSMELYEKTGLIANAKHVLPKLRWFSEEEPEIYGKASRWLSVADYIILRLTGRAVTDYTLASRTMCFNVKTRAWDPSLIELSGGRDLFPDAVPLGTAAGPLSPDGAAALGVNGNPPVIAAGHDHVCSAFAVGCADSGDVCDSMGTSEALVGLNSSFRPDEVTLGNGINQGCWDVGRHYWMANIPASGGSLEWFKRTIANGGHLPSLHDRDAVRTSGDLFYFPYLDGAGTPSMKTSVRGAFIGLSSRTTREDLLEAVYEGISYQTRWVLDVIESSGKERTGILKVIGGATRNDAWMRAKADILGRTIRRFEVHEVAAAGAALLAARGAGYGDGKLEGTGAGEGSLDLVPDPRVKDYHDRRYASYRDLSRLLLSMHEVMEKD